MKVTDPISNAYDLSQMILTTYASDLTNEELLTRPGEGCNHVAWQLGHLISSECNLLNSVAPGYAIELPDGFEANHSKENTASDDPSQFLTTEQYLELFGKLKTAVQAALENQSEEDLEGPAPEFLRQICPNVAGVFLLIATHPMMHAGQLVPVRRKLGKPVKI